MFDKIKKQKQQKTNRNNLRMFTHLLEQPSSVLTKSYSNINKLNTLKVITSIHLNYLIFSYIEALNKANQLNISMSQSSNNIGIENIKVGIIGGGVMGRFILNSLLVLQKQGLQPSNITLSTRQFQDLQLYNSQFKVNILFDNQKVAQQSDILIITVPATLDNWIIAQLRQPLSKRINRNTSANTSMNTTANNINNTTSNAKNTTSSHAGSLGNTSNININVSNLANTSNKNITNPGMDTSPNKNLLNPFVYVTTSNMNKQKLNKLFDFPIITPLIRGEQLDYLNSAINQCGLDKNTDREKCLQKIQKFILPKFQQKAEQIKQLLMYVFDKYFYNADKDRRYTSFNSTDRNSKSGKTITMSQKKQQKIESNQSSVNLSQYAKNYNNLEMIKTLIQQIMQTNEDLQQTFLVRCRKWRMAYNNYIS